MNVWEWVNMACSVKGFEIRKKLYKCSPFTIYIDIGIQTLYLALCLSPLAMTTVLSLLEYDMTSFAEQNLGNF